MGLRNILIIVVATVLFLTIICIIIFQFKRGAKRMKERHDKAVFDAGIKRFEEKNFKKCRHCGGNVPKDDNICPECNQIP